MFNEITSSTTNTNNRDVFLDKSNSPRVCTCAPFLLPVMRPLSPVLENVLLCLTAWGCLQCFSVCLHMCLNVCICVYLVCHVEVSTSVN